MTATAPDDRPRPDEAGRPPAAAPRGGPRRRQAVAAASGGALLAGTWALVAPDPERVPGWEHTVFDAVNGLSGGLEVLLWPVMQLGTVAMYLVGGVLAYALTQRISPALAAASAVLAAWLSARAVKDAVGRPRPGDLLDGVDLRESQPDGHGFVSSHTTVAFALAVVLTALLPGRWRWVPVPVAAAVGVARMFFGVHLPLDVVGGAGLGILCGMAACLAFGVTGERRGRA